MIQVEKGAVPTALVTAQGEIEADLLEKKEKFKWETTHYSRPIKQELKDLYHNKCAFCEVKLTEQDTEQKFTVEHFRPKTFYWWLGNEWTNLFPTCWKCNNNKGDDFDLRYGTRRQVKEPIITHNQLDRAACKADAEHFIKEDAYFLHPEVDVPEDFFEFLPNGKIQPNRALNDWQKSRAQKMIDKFLGLPSLEERRHQYIESFREDLERAVKSFLDITKGEDYTDREIKLSFRPFFEKLMGASASSAIFSRLGYTMSKNFEAFFLVSDSYNPELQEFLKYAFELCVSDLKDKN